MTNSICLDENYSSTWLIIKEKLKSINQPEDNSEIILSWVKKESRKTEGRLRINGNFKKLYHTVYIVELLIYKKLYKIKTFKKNILKVGNI